MTLTENESSNKRDFESLPTERVFALLRTAMDEGCIRPAHVYDLVDEVMDRLSWLEKGRKGDNRAIHEVGETVRPTAHGLPYKVVAVREKYGVRLYDLARKPIAKEYEESLSAENPEYLQGVSLP